MNTRTLNEVIDEWYENRRKNPDWNSLDLKGVPSSEITGELFDLVDVKTLRLYGYKQIEEFPENVKDFVNLERLYFIGSFDFPRNIDKLLNLNEIRIMPHSGKNSVNLLGYPPNAFCCFRDLKKLKKLTISNCTLDSTFNYIFANTPNLEVLTFSRCQSLKEIPTAIKSLKKLKELDLRTNQIEFIDENIIKDKNLHRLYLDSNNIKILPESILDIPLLSFSYNPIQFPNILNVKDVNDQSNSMLDKAEFKAYYQKLEFDEKYGITQRQLQRDLLAIIQESMKATKSINANIQQLSEKINGLNESNAKDMLVVLNELKNLLKNSEETKDLMIKSQEELLKMSVNFGPLSMDVNNIVKKLRNRSV